MPLDTNLLYGVMAGSWITHLAIPFATFLLVRSLPYMDLLPKTLLFLSICVVLSFGTQMGLLAVLQSSSCGGIKDYRSIGIGAGIAALITAVIGAIPTFIEPMRLVVSQLIMRHKTLLTPQLAKMEALMSKTAEQVLTASLSEDVVPAVVQKGGAAISPEEYETQTFQEIAIGTGYWVAFAGAYGLGLGSLLATKCPATS